MLGEEALKKMKRLLAIAAYFQSLMPKDEADEVDEIKKWLEENKMD